MPTLRDWEITLIAVIVLIGGFIMLYFHIDGEVKALMGLVVGFYFGRYIPNPKEE
jgi:hypothetical protein